MTPSTAIVPGPGPAAAPAEPRPSAVPLSGRLGSVDAFRGITVAGMILVNNPGSWEFVYPPLRHARWHGWTPTDLVFPFFLFAIGMSMALSFARRSLQGEDRRRLYRKIAVRSAILFVLGLALNAVEVLDGGGLRVPLAAFRIPGVLQRIAVVYLAAALVVLHTGWRGQARAAAACLVSYWALMTLVPVPGYGAGDLSYPDHNLAAHLDRLLLRGHLGGRTWDGLGLLSTLPAVASTLLGVLAAGLLRSGREPREIAGWIFVAGWAGILGGLAWDLVFPINKLLWTSSYVLFTTGAALELLGVCYWLVDIHGFRRTALPAVVLGSNALTAFVLSTLVYLAICPRPFNSPGFSVRRWLFEHLFLPWASPAGASLAFAITYVLLWLGVAALLYRRRIFIKV